MSFFVETRCNKGTRLPWLGTGGIWKVKSPRWHAALRAATNEDVREAGRLDCGGEDGPQRPLGNTTSPAAPIAQSLKATEMCSDYYCCCYYSGRQGIGQ